jgi:hypothetical protein
MKTLTLIIGAIYGMTSVILGALAHTLQKVIICRKINKVLKLVLNTKCITLYCFSSLDFSSNLKQEQKNGQLGALFWE